MILEPDPPPPYCIWFGIALCIGNVTILDVERGIRSCILPVSIHVVAHDTGFEEAMFCIGYDVHDGIGPIITFGTCPCVKFDDGFGATFSVGSYDINQCVEIHCTVQAYMKNIVYKPDMKDKAHKPQGMDCEDIEASSPMEGHMVQNFVFHMELVCYSMIGRNLMVQTDHFVL